MEGEDDPVGPRIRRGPAEGIEEGRIEVGDGRVGLVEDCHAVGDDAVGPIDDTVSPSRAAATVDALERALERTGDDG